MSLLNTRRRLLIVDDNPEIHEDIKKILNVRTANPDLDDIESMMFGDVASQSDPIGQFEIDDAYQGQDALEMVQRSVDENDPYDVAIVDMRMPPGWDGVETIERLWQVDSDLQVVICTAYSDYSWDEVFARLGVQDKLLILKKPFDDCEISQSARALSEKRKLLQGARHNLNTLHELVSLRTQELEEAHGESARLLAAISSALIGLDSDSRVSRWNQAAEKMFRISPTNAIGKRMEELAIPWSAPHFLTQLKTIVDSATNAHVETQIGIVDESPAFLSFSVYPIDNGGGQQGALILANDVTERHELEHQLQHAQKLESVGQLAAGIAHEINTPMQYVGDNVQFLKRTFNQLQPILEWFCGLDEHIASSDFKVTPPPQVARATLSRILKQLPSAITDSEAGIEQVSRIVRAMKEYSHPGTDTPQSVDLNQLLESVLIVAKSEWKYVATVETQLATELTSIEGFSGELQQVFLNLIVNAAHAIGSATNNGANGLGCIHIATSQCDTYCRVSIRDSGIGIPKSIQRRVFDPFFTTKEVGKGTGQGLTIAHQIVVQKHLGKIWFESDPGNGTTFFVELPIRLETKIS